MKTFKILFLVNKGVNPSDVDVICQTRLAGWLNAISKGLLNLSYTIKEVYLPTNKLVRYGDDPRTTQLEGYLGLDFSLLTTPPYGIEAVGYHWVVFCWKPQDATQGIANFTTIWNGRPSTQWVQPFNGNLGFNELRHEAIHGFFANLRLKGIYLQDELDSHATSEGEEIELKKIEPYWDKLVEPLPVDKVIPILVGIINALQAAINLISRRKTLRDLAEAMAIFEGWNNRMSRARRNNNPGNLKWSPYAIGYDEDGFAKFATEQDGWDAFIWDLLQKKLGNTRTGLSGESTLKDLIWTWTADPDEIKQTYLSFVCSKLGVSALTKLKEFV
jgi:DnaJ-domain-containing protein 1